MMDIAKKIKSVVLGHAVGDALGVPVEFCEREALDENPVTDMVGYGTYPYPAGSWSDDTSMSITALDSLADGKLNFDDIMIRFGEWYYNDKYTPTGEMFDVGNTCSFAIDNYFAYHKPIGVCGLAGERDNGNGSLMRIHPFALMAWCRSELRGDWETIIEKASALTHAHERSKLGCKIYTLILFHLLDHPSRASVKLALNMARCRYIANPEYCHYKRLLTTGFERLPRDEIKSTGYVVDTLEAAVWCLLTTNSYRECVLKAVNLGDDTDTVAAFTATAIAEVKDDIEYSLKLRSTFRITTGFDRPNLKFLVRRTKKKKDALLEILKRHSEDSGIIYCSTRKAVEAVGNELIDAGFSATIYHAGLEDDLRKSNQEDFVYDRSRIMVATNAFGMGIDKSNVSYVIHYNMPQDVETTIKRRDARGGMDPRLSACCYIVPQTFIPINF